MDEIFKEADDYIGHSYDEDESPNITHCRNAFINGAVFGASKMSNKILTYLKKCVI